MPLFTKSYNRPNSVAYDATTKSYYISNLEGGTITQLDSNYNTSEVITGLTAPKDLVFASFGPYQGLLILDSNEVKVYNVSGFIFVASFPVTNAIDLEDAEADKTQPNIFFISDPKAHIVFKVEIGGAPFYQPTFSIHSRKVRNPKALLFDSKNRLLVTSDTLSSPIYEMNTSTGLVSLVQTTAIDYINGLEEDAQGNFYATSWGDNYFYRLDKDFKNAKGLTSYSKPTGMYFNKAADVIVLACSNCNKIEFHNLHLVNLNDVDSARCPGDSFYVNINQQFKGKGTYNSSNVFYAEISDSKGSFKSPLVIGSVSSVNEPSSMLLSLPKGLRFTGSNYKFRIRSNNPAHYSLNELDLNMPYVPLSNISVKDSIDFCPPATLAFGIKNDIDSGFVNYTWFENNIKISEKRPVYSANFNSNTKLKLIKTSLKGQCVVGDSVQLTVSKNIYIPYQDSFRVCENNAISIGGDSITDTKIEWSSRLHPTIKREFNPSYNFTANDTFTVKVSSVLGSCSSQKQIYIYVEPKPDLYFTRDQNYICSEDFLSILPILKQGFEHRIKFTWSPSVNLDNPEKKNTVFYTNQAGTYQYKLVATDTVFQCSDSNYFKVYNIERPVKPILGSNAKGAVIKNFDLKYTYRWYKDGVLKTQPVKDSQYVVSGAEEVYGTYKVIVINKDSTECVDSSNSFTIVPLINVGTTNRGTILIYPNPASDILRIEGVNGGLFDIIDYTGRSIKAGMLNENKSIEIKEMVEGLYLIHINFEGRTYSGSFIKK
jgi:hypothetical protein